MKIMEFCQAHGISMSFNKDTENLGYSFHFTKDDKKFTVTIPFKEFLSENDHIDETLIKSVKEYYEIKE